MTLQTNAEIVRALFEAFNRRDVEAHLDLVASNGEWGPAFTGGGLIEGVVWRGHEGVPRSYEVQAEKFETVTADLVEIEDLGDKVLAEVHLSAVKRGNVDPVDRTTWNVFQVRDGKVASGIVYPSRQAALEAVGVSDS